MVARSRVPYGAEKGLLVRHGTAQHHSTIAGTLHPSSVVFHFVFHSIVNIRVQINSNGFGVFLDLISRFEFEFRRCAIFFF